MLEYVKTILQKVSFDGKLFEKELKKAFKLLSKEELILLKNWCYQTYEGIYQLTLNEVFLKAQV